MLSSSYDVLVVGAGPSGSAAAIAFLLGDPGLSVGIADKQEFPRDKACGDGLGPAAVRRLAGLGVDVGAIRGANAIRAAQVVGGEEVSFLAEMSGGVVVRRFDMDEAVRDRAIMLGAEPLPLARFCEMHEDGAVNRVILKDGQTGAEREVRCRLLVGADGAGSRVRRQIGIASEPDHRTGIAIRAYAEGVPDGWRDLILLGFEDWLHAGYGWMFPLSDGTANVGVGMTVEAFKRGGSARSLEEMLDMWVLSGLRMRGISVGEHSGRSVYRLPHGGRIPTLSSGQTALIGDAGSMINPLSGEGIAYGLAAAEMLADHCVSAVARGRDVAAAARAYDDAFRSRFRSHFLSCYLVHKMLRSRLCRRSWFKAANDDPALAGQAVDMLFGDGRLRSADIRRMAEILARHGANRATSRMLSWASSAASRPGR